MKTRNAPPTGNVIKVDQVIRVTRHARALVLKQHNSKGSVGAARKVSPNWLQETTLRLYCLKLPFNLCVFLFFIIIIIIQSLL